MSADGRTCARHVLVVDDDVAIGRLVSLVLGSAGIEVTAVTNCEAGLSAAAEHQPDATLIDITLQPMSGPEVVAAFGMTVGKPVIVFTGMLAPALLTQCLTAGAFDIAQKPFDPDDLEASVSLAVQQQPRVGLSQAVVKAGTMLVDFAAYRLTNRFDAPDHNLHLSLSEWRLLEVLTSRKGETVLYQELLGRVWGPGFRTHLDFLKTWMARLQRKVALSEFHGVGYALMV